VFRRLYKQAESAFDEDLLVELILRLDREPLDRASTPSPATVGYFKRRVRRLLRNLGKQNPDAHRRLSVQVLSQSGIGQDSLPGHCWVAFDLLFGRKHRTRASSMDIPSAAPRVVQTRHGRGNYRLLRARPRLREMQDRLSDVFPDAADVFRDLATDPRRPWQILEMAMLRLRRLGVEIDPSPEILARYVASPSPFLWQCAARLVLARPELLPKANALDMAKLFYRSSRLRRLRLRSDLEGSGVSPAWRKAFARELWEQVGRDLASLHPRSRALDSIAILRSWCIDVLPRDLVLRSASRLFAGELVELVRIPRLTPTKIAVLREQLGIQDMADLAVACDSDRVAGLPGFDSKLQSAILKGLWALRMEAVRRQQVAGAGSEFVGKAEVLYRLRQLEPKNIGGKWGFIDEAGNIVIAPCFDAAESFSEGLAAIGIKEPDRRKPQTKWGFIDEAGNTMIAPRFDDVESFSEGLAAVGVNESGRRWASSKWGFVDSKGDFAVAPRYDGVGPFSEGLAAVEIYQWGREVNEWFDRWGFIDRTGQVVITPQFQEVREFCDGVAAAELDGQWGFIDKQGNWVIAPRFEDVCSFTEELAGAKTGGKWGFFDRAGEVVIQPQFEEVRGFCDGAAAAKLDGRWGFINTSGSFIVETRYRWLSPASMGLSGLSLSLDDPDLLANAVFADAVRMPPGVELAYDALRYGEKLEIPGWLDAVAFQTLPTKQRLAEALGPLARNWEFTPSEALQILNGRTRWSDETGWGLIALSKTDSLARGEIWQYLLDHSEDEETDCSYHLNMPAAVRVVISSSQAREAVIERLRKFPDLTCEAFAEGSEEVQSLAEGALRRVPARRFAAWLRRVSSIREDRREPALTALLGRYARMPIETAVCRALVYNEDEHVRQFGWKFLKENPPSRQVLGELCAEFLAARPNSPMMRTALASPEAAIVLLRGGYFRAKPKRFEDFLRVLVDAVPGMSCLAILDLIEAVPENEWPEMRRRFLDRLRDEPVFSNSFWLAVFDRLPASEALRERLAGDEDFQSSFYGIDEPWFLGRSDGAVVSWIAGWVDRHTTAIVQNRDVTLRLATNQDPQLRRLGLQLMLVQGLDTPRALRLVESGLPEAVETGRRFFEDLMAASPECAEAALALCDSPDRPTREFGWSFVEQRREQVLTPEFVSHLAENPDAWLRTRVAEYFLDHPVENSVTTAFDRVVLRSPWQGRAAKRLVRRRLEATGTKDVATLQALAHGANREDAEWAMGELLKATLAGESVSGFTVKQNPIS
jgi:hypothetical protein